MRPEKPTIDMIRKWREDVLSQIHVLEETRCPNSETYLAVGTELRKHHVIAMLLGFYIEALVADALDEDGDQEA